MARTPVTGSMPLTGLVLGRAAATPAPFRLRLGLLCYTECFAPAAFQSARLRVRESPTR